MRNEYFQTLPTEVQQALGNAAYSAFLLHEPSFKWKGDWSNIDDEFKSRWLSVVQAVMEQLRGLEEHVTTRMDLFNEARKVLDDATTRFEAIRADDAGFNNYQLLEWLRSAHAEIINARLLMLRADIAAGNVNNSGDESTQRVNIPNVHTSED